MIGQRSAAFGFMKTHEISGMTRDDCVVLVRSVLQDLSPETPVTLAPPRATCLGVSETSANNARASVGDYRLVTIVRMELATGAAQALAPYFPLFIVLGLIALASLAGASWMMGFMAGCYLVFGGAKLLDLSGFARAYAQYDVIAKQLPAWGYAYPFIELGLGFAFLFYWQMWPATWVALTLGLIGAAGVIRSVWRRETIPCACLGTMFKLPMSNVTVLESLSMAGMALWMLTVGM